MLVTHVGKPRQDALVEIHVHAAKVLVFRATMATESVIRSESESNILDRALFNFNIG